jgi:hypothetical protein
MTPLSKITQVLKRLIRHVRQADRHCLGHAALAAVHGIAGALILLGVPVSEVAVAWAVAVIYAVLSQFPGHHGSA